MYKNVPVSVLGEQGLESDESEPEVAKQKIVKNFKAKQQLTNSIVEHTCYLSLKYVLQPFTEFFWLQLEANSRISFKKRMIQTSLCLFFSLFDRQFLRLRRYCHDKVIQSS